MKQNKPGLFLQENGDNQRTPMHLFQLLFHVFFSHFFLSESRGLRYLPGPVFGIRTSESKGPTSWMVSSM